MGGWLDASRRQDRDLPRRHSFARRRASGTGSWPAIAVLVCAIAALASIGLLGALIWFALPTGDDFCYAAMHLRDVWPFVVRVYLRQGGRWSTTLVEGLTTSAISNIVRAYPFLLAGLLIIRLASAYALARSVFHRDVSRTRCAIVSASFCLLYWCAMPSIGDSMFWMTGAFFYELTASGMLLFLAGLFRGPLTAARTLALCLAAILLTGGHEVAAFAVVFIVMGGAALAVYCKSADRGFWVMLLVASVAGLSIALAAPGNFVRAEQLGESHSVIHTVLLTGWLTLRRVPLWILDPPLLLAALALFLDPSVRLKDELRLKDEWTKKGHDLRLAVVVLAAGASLLMGFLIPAWASHGVMPGRLLNWQYFVLLSGLCAILLLLKPPVHMTFDLQPAVAAAAVLAMLVLGNPRLAAQDLVLRIPDWSRAKRAALASIWIGGAFPQLPEPPHMYFDYDVNNNPSSHPNVCVSRYYGLPSIVGPRPGTNGADLTGRSR